MVKDRMLPVVEEKINRYRDEHRGENPLYILMPTDEADRLREEVRRDRGYGEDVPVTEFNGMKIVPSPALKTGEVLLTNELPETGS